MQAQLPGANPETMASAVATPLEKQFSTIAGIDTMTSVSTSGQSTILLQFSLDRNIDGAAQDVQSAIAAAARSLPSTLPNPPTQRKVNPADFPVLLLALTSETQPLSVVDDYGENLLAQRISTINGVAQVQVYGSQQYAVRIQLDPNQLASRGIALTDVEQAVGDANVNLPTGTLYGRERATTVQASGQLNNAQAYAPIIVAYRNGAPVRLSQLGRVFDSVQNDKVAAWYNGTRGVVLAVQRQPGTNTIEIVDSVKSILPTFETQLPPSINLSILYDRSQSIRESVRDVQLTLLLALALVVGVIFVFLRSASATFIPSLALPLSIIGTFSVMYVFKYSLDNLSLMALTLCVGFVVDDAIVMLENITRHMEMGSRGCGDPRRSEGDRFHHRVDDALARRRVPPRVPDGRHPRPSPARVRGDNHRRGADLGVCLSHADPAAVQPHAQGGARAKARAHLRSLGADVRRDARGVSGRPRLGARAPPGHRSGILCDLRGDRCAVLLHAQGLSAERRRRTIVHHHRGGAGHFVRRHGESPAPGRRTVRQNPHVEGAMSFVGAAGPAQRSTTGAYS